MITRSHIIYQSFNDADITVEHLEAIASLRYGLSFTANLISKCYQTNDYYDSLQPIEKQYLQQLFHEVENACFHTQICEYLIKFTARKFGIQFLKKIVDQPAFHWLIPSHLKPKKQVSLLLVLYNFTAFS